MKKVIAERYNYLFTNQFYDCFEKDGHKYFGYEVSHTSEYFGYGLSTPTEYRLFSTTHINFGTKTYI